MRQAIGLLIDQDKFCPLFLLTIIILIFESVFYIKFNINGRVILVILQYKDYFVNKGLENLLRLWNT
jgi:hypothetical protein